MDTGEYWVVSSSSNNSHTFILQCDFVVPGDIFSVSLKNTVGWIVILQHCLPEDKYKWIMLRPRTNSHAWSGCRNPRLPQWFVVKLEALGVRGSCRVVVMKRKVV
jgi:hypothetical protein